MNIFDEIKNKKKYNPNANHAWFKRNVTNAFKTLGTQAFLGMNQTGENAWQTTRPELGRVTAFGYFPKFHETLPVYDKFPVILPFHMEGDHMLGLNLHYLSFEFRLLLLDKLIQIDSKGNRPNMTDTNFDKNTKLKLSWQLLKAVSQHGEAQYAVKKYLFGHVKTNFVNIAIENWPIVACLPLARFEKMTEAQVHRKFRSRNK